MAFRRNWRTYWKAVRFAKSIFVNWNKVQISFKSNTFEICSFIWKYSEIKIKSSLIVDDRQTQTVLCLSRAIISKSEPTATFNYVNDFMWSSSTTAFQTERKKQRRQRRVTQLYLPQCPAIFQHKHGQPLSEFISRYVRFSLSAWRTGSRLGQKATFTYC